MGIETECFEMKGFRIQNNRLKPPERTGSGIDVIFVSAVEIGVVNLYLVGMPENDDIVLSQQFHGITVILETIVFAFSSESFVKIQKGIIECLYNRSP
jgi:hypothetical protein